MRSKWQAVDVRAVLEASGLDHGPISVFERMQTMGLQAPSVAALARLLPLLGASCRPSCVPHDC